MRHQQWARGFPTDQSLHDRLDIVSLLRQLLEYGSVEFRTPSALILECQRKGWIHSEENNTGTTFFFPSPLHTAFHSWRLEPTDDSPSFASPLALVLEVVKRFKRSQLMIPIRRVSQTKVSITTPPEAQYQDEFYRSLFEETKGNVRVSPEFASAQKARVAGRIDFFLPRPKWGVELTREGDRLAQHASRFGSTGAYGEWLQANEMHDYVLIDCRTTVPSKKHAGK